MKHLFHIFIITACLLALSACGRSPKQEASAGGSAGSRQYPGQATEIEVRDIYLKLEGQEQGPQVIFDLDEKNPRVELKGPEDVLSSVRVEFSGDKLSISGDASKRFSLSEPLVITIYDRQQIYDKISLAGGCRARVNWQTGLGSYYKYLTEGGISATVISDRTMKIILSGGSSLTSPSLKSGKMEMDISGASRLETEFIQCESWKLDLSGASALATVHVMADKADWHVSGAAAMDLGEGNMDGSATELFAVLAGASQVHALGFTVQKATLTLSGGAGLECHVTELLGGSITGGSKVVYQGSPTLATHVGSSSSLEKK